MMKKDERYPYVVIRFMAAVYGHPKVILRARPGRRVRNAEAYLIEGQVFVKQGILTAQGRAHLIAEVLGDVQKTGFRIGVVFSETDSAYCECDGTATPMREAPSGGIRIDHVQVISTKGREN